MENKELIKKLVEDLKAYPNMSTELFLQKCEALRTLYSRSDDLSHALGINLELRKRLNIALNAENYSASEKKQLLNKYWQTYLFGAVDKVAKSKGK